MNTINLGNSDHDLQQIIAQVIANAEPMV